MAALRVRNLDLLRRRDARTHKSATMTLDLSGQLFADQLDEVADAMSAARALARDHADFLRTNSADVYRFSGENKSRAQ